jgi:hypothetical protein
MPQRRRSDSEDRMPTAPGSKSDEITPDLAKFYERPDNFAVLRAINSTAPPISLRALAWFVSNGVDDAVIREDYGRNLRAHTRRRFDPFRRCERLVLRIEGDKVETTIGQMNFFKWMIETGLWSFVAENRARVCAQVARQTNSSVRSTGTGKCGAGACAPGFSQLCGHHVVVFD